MAELPPGFKFDPSREQIFRYLRNKVYNTLEPYVNLELVKELDLYRCCPSDHQGLSKAECTYFFTQRVAKYQSSRVSNRTTKDGKGYWRVDKSEKFELGIRNSLAYYLKGGNVKGRGLRTDWIMHEYELKPADAKVKVNKTMVLCRIHHHKKQKQKRKETDICNASEQVPDSSTKDGSGSGEKLIMIESSQEYQQKNFVAPANKEFVCINLCSDDDESSEGYDTLKNRIPAEDGRGRDGENLMMIESSHEYQLENIAASAIPYK